MKDRITTVWNGKRVEAIGSSVLMVPEEYTFHEVILANAKQVLGNNWLEEQRTLPANDRHPLGRLFVHFFNWSVANATEQNRTGTLFGALPSGYVYSLLGFAYDLYCVAHTGALPDDLVGRLRDPEKFQGARHELYGAATFARADFQIHFVPAHPSGKTHEFNAYCPRWDETIAVECKSRVRPGAWTEDSPPPDPATIRAGVEALINRAIEQRPAKLPFIVFIEANVPELRETPLTETIWWRDLLVAASRRGDATAANPAPYAACIVSNHAYQYERADLAGSIFRNAFAIEVPDHARVPTKIPLLHHRLNAALSSNVPVQ